MTGPERVRAELDILGLDASAHIVDFYGPMLDALGVTRSTEILGYPQPQRGPHRRGQGRDPDATGPQRSTGRVPHPRRRDGADRRDVLRGRPGALRDDGLPLVDAPRPRHHPADRPARHLGPRHRSVGAVRRCGTRGPAAGSRPSSPPWRPRTARWWPATTPPSPPPWRPTVATCRSPRGSVPAVAAANAAATPPISSPTPACRGATGTTPTTPHGSTGPPRWRRSPPEKKPATRRGPAAWAVAARCRRVGPRRRAPDGCSSTRPGFTPVALRRRQAGRRGHPRRPRPRDVADRPRRGPRSRRLGPSPTPPPARPVGPPDGWRLGPQRERGTSPGRREHPGHAAAQALARQPRKLGALG